ncbi:hypothetical protein HCUR_00174 [Holospora curviuscula]|uniref:Uncharacterized protein n=1 Tax=Holospora curviuscula TaxID=1082868 RepID=A0A2S5RED2_9PROT|nr:hypothetical protein HCUR_00174 [Holospora curviuscula]
MLGNVSVIFSKKSLTQKVIKGKLHEDVKLYWNDPMNGSMKPMIKVMDALSSLLTVVSHDGA